MSAQFLYIYTTISQGYGCNQVYLLKLSADPARSGESSPRVGRGRGRTVSLHCALGRLIISGIKFKWIYKIYKIWILLLGQSESCKLGSVVQGISKQ